MTERARTKIPTTEPFRITNHKSRITRRGSIDLAMLALVIVWGVNFPIVKIAFREMTPMVFNALRFGGATVLLLAVLWRAGEPVPPKAMRLRLVVLGRLHRLLTPLPADGVPAAADDADDGSGCAPVARRLGAATAATVVGGGELAGLGSPGLLHRVLHRRGLRRLVCLGESGRRSSHRGLLQPDPHRYPGVVLAAARRDPGPGTGRRRSRGAGRGFSRAHVTALPRDAESARSRRGAESSVQGSQCGSQRRGSGDVSTSGRCGHPHHHGRRYHPAGRRPGLAEVYAPRARLLRQLPG